MEHKRGDSFDYGFLIPSTYADGYFAGWTVAAQVRDATGKLVADLQATWDDPVTTRAVRLLKINTKTWPLGDLAFDVQFTRPADGYSISTATVEFTVIKDVTLA